MVRIYPSAKNRILDATERVLLRDGPSGLSIDAVLRESGVSKGGFFHHFASKDAPPPAPPGRLSLVPQEHITASMEGDPEPHGRSLRAQIALAFDMAPAER